MSDARMDQAKGDIKTAAGKVTGDTDLEARGRAESAEAGVRKEAGDVFDKAKQVGGDMVDDARDAAGDMAGKARDVAGDVSDKASDMARQATDKAQDILSR